MWAEQHRPGGSDVMSRLETGGLKAGCLYSRPCGWRLEGGLRTSVEAALVSEGFVPDGPGRQEAGLPGKR